MAVTAVYFSSQGHHTVGLVRSHSAIGMLWVLLYRALHFILLAPCGAVGLQIIQRSKRGDRRKVVGGQKKHIEEGAAE